MLVCSLPMKIREKLAHDITDACATIAGLVHDVACSDCQTQMAVFSQPSDDDF